MSFGERLRLLREKKDLSREELAQKLKVTYWTISKYETNKRTPDSDTLVKIADYFNVSTDYLLGRSKTVLPSDKTEDDNRSFFAKRLEILRHERNLSQEDLARALELETTTIVEYEKDKEPDYVTLARIAQLFTCSTDYLLGITDQRNLLLEKIEETHDSDDLDDEILDSQLAASMKSEYGKEPSDEYKDMAKRIYKKVLAEVTKEAEDAERKKKNDD